MEKKQSLTFYEVTEELADDNFDKYALEWEQYFEWYKSNSKSITFTEEFYFDIFKCCPKVSNIIYAGILDDEAARSTNKSRRIQFRIEKYVASQLIKSIKEQQNCKNNSEMIKFVEMLENVASKNMIVWGEYDTQNGWFDYEEAMKTKRKIRDEMKN